MPPHHPQHRVIWSVFIRDIRGFISPSAMPTIRLLPACLIGLLLGASLVRAEDDGEKDLKKMAGEWVPVLMQLNGKKQPDSVLKSIRLTIAGNTYKTQAGKELDEGTLAVDASKEPRQIDITSTVGPNKGKAIPAIYEFKGGELRLCYGLQGTDRPAEFKSPEDTKGVVLLMAYKRAPKKSSR